MVNAMSNMLVKMGEYAANRGSVVPMVPDTEPIERIGRELRDALQIVFGIVLGLMGFFAIGFAIWVGFRLASAEDEGKRKEAKKQLLWSIIAVVAIVVLIIVIFILLEVLIDVAEDIPGGGGTGGDGL